METQETECSLRVLKIKNDITEVLGLASSTVVKDSRGKDKGKEYSSDQNPEYECAVVALWE